MRGILFAIVGLAILPAAAHADFSTHPLDGHADAISAFTGHELFFSTLGADTLDIRVDYAVFAPGVFQSIAGAVYTPFGGFPGLGATDYVYAYQIYNQGDPDNGSGTEPLSSLEIGLAGGTVLSVGEETGGAFEPVGVGETPAGAFSLIDSVFYSYIGSNLLLDTFSTVLLFTSPDPPAFANASVDDFGLSTQAMLPSPVPEPGAALLGFIGLGLVGAVKRRLA